MKKQKSLKLKPAENASFESAIVKRIPKEYMLSAIFKKYPDIRKPLLGFTLPGTSYVFEKQLLDTRSKDTLICIEKSKSIFNKSEELRKIHRLKKIFLYNTTDEKYFKNCNEKFNYIWLDYCGSLTKTKIKVFDNILANNLDFDAGNPIVGFTFLGSMDFGSKSTIDEYANEAHSLEFFDRPFNSDKFDVRMTGIPMWLNKIANEQGKTVLPKTILRYRDISLNSQAAPLSFFIFEVFNNVIDFTFNNTDINDITLASFH